MQHSVQQPGAGTLRPSPTGFIVQQDGRSDRVLNEGFYPINMVTPVLHQVYTTR